MKQCFFLNSNPVCIGGKKFHLIWPAFCFKGGESVGNGLVSSKKICKILKNTVHYNLLHVLTYLQQIQIFYK